MKRSTVIQKIFAFVFTAIVLFTVSVRETHYLFSDHHAVSEHCENHLHSSDDHGDCAVCKFDVSFFTDNILYPQFIGQLFSITEQTSVCQTTVLAAGNYINPLRGPPSRA